MSRLIAHHELETVLDWPQLIDQLRQWYQKGAVEAPARQVLPITQPDGSEASLLIMPAWVSGESIGVKVVTFFPENAGKGRPTINAGYLLFDGGTGQIRAAMDGDSLTARRTAAASALAASYLARRDAARLVIAGTGQLSAEVAAAHCAVRDYTSVSIWGRTPAKAAAIAADLAAQGIPAKAVENLEAACREADVISTVTASTRPLILGRWLKPGCHLDLIGAFKADMRESDDQAIVQAQVFADQRAGAMLAGDLARPLQTGIITREHIRSDLAELCRGSHPGRTEADQRTVFKSVGMALQDLAAASLAADQLISG
ncbi:ornithine cyclodeaminase family protein [Roseobacteraceae bacterium NS-SX3]